MCYPRADGARSTRVERGVVDEGKGGRRLSWNEARDLLRIDDGRLWLLILVCVALVFTIQAVEGSVEGVWPHQRRPARLAPGARAVHGIWSYVALLLLPGMLLGVLNLAVLLWRDMPRTEAQLLGGFFVGLVWLIFIAVSLNAFGLGRFMGQVGPVGPIAMMAVLIVGDLLLLIALLDMLPSLNAVRDALQFAS